METSPPGAPLQLLEIGLAHGQRQAAQILAIEREDVEGVKLDLLLVLAGVQGVEIGNAVDAEDDGDSGNMEREFVGHGQ